MQPHLKETICALLFCTVPLAVNAQNCAPPPPLGDENRKVDTEGAIGQFMKLVGLNVKTSVATQKTAVFVNYPGADQMIVALTTQYNVCMILRESKDMSSAEKIQVLMTLNREFAPARGPQPIDSTAPRRTMPSPQDQLGGEKKSEWLPEVPFVRLIAMSAPAESKGEKRKASWADIYLNPLPIVITDKNKYFVIVGSASTEAQGSRQMKALKAKHPEYDFELYGPYGSNPSFGIMIASWVSRERAAEALQVARKIEKTSFEWSCRSTGDAC